MPEYSFYCRKCKHKFSRYWNISQYDKEIDLIECESCSADKSFVSRDYQEDNMVVSYHEVKTIGQLADRNTKKMGKYELQDKMREDNMDFHKKNKEVAAKRRRLNKMTPEQKKKWIMEGD